MVAGFPDQITSQELSNVIGKWGEHESMEPIMYLNYHTSEIKINRE